MLSIQYRESSSITQKLITITQLVNAYQKLTNSNDRDAYAKMCEPNSNELLMG